MSCLIRTFLIDRENLKGLALHLIWAPSSEFVSSSIPSWQILTAHAQPFRGARELAFCLKGPLDSLLIWASSEGSGETARMRRLAWTFAARIGDKYQIPLTRSIWYFGTYTEPQGFKKNPKVVHATHISKITNFSERLKDRTLKKYFVNSVNVKNDFKCYKVLRGTI